MDINYYGKVNQSNKYLKYYKERWVKVEELLEMAKGKTKRKTAAKNARKRKAEKPTMDDPNNPVAKFAQTSGAGFHDKASDKSRKRRKEDKTQIKDQMDS